MPNKTYPSWDLRGGADVFVGAARFLSKLEDNKDIQPISVPRKTVLSPDTPAFVSMRGAKRNCKLWIFNTPPSKKSYKKRIGAIYVYANNRIRTECDVEEPLVRIGNHGRLLRLPSIKWTDILENVIYITLSSFPEWGKTIDPGNFYRLAIDWREFYWLLMFEIYADQSPVDPHGNIYLDIVSVRIQRALDRVELTNVVRSWCVHHISNKVVMEWMGI